MLLEDEERGSIAMINTWMGSIRQGSDTNEDTQVRRWTILSNYRMGW
jgi:hypothetical protein